MKKSTRERAITRAARALYRAQVPWLLRERGVYAIPTFDMMRELYERMARAASKELLGRHAGGSRP